MSAERSSRHRSPPPRDFMSFLFGQPERPPPPRSPFSQTTPGTQSRPSGMSSEPTRPSSLNRHDQLPQQPPLFSPPPLDSFLRSPSDEGSALPPLSSTPSSTTPQQPLPPLRSLNRSITTPGILPHLFPQATQPRPPPPLSSVFSRPTRPQDPNISSLPFGYRPGRSRSSNLTSVISSLDEIGHSLEDANAHLRALLDIPQTDLLTQHPWSQSSSLPHAMSSRSTTSSGNRRESSRSDENSRLNKRRKLDSEKADAPSCTGFRYGRYGQVEAGDLTMEIVSCDGGLFADGTSHAAENILKNDNSVYCTKGNRCNIVLQHQGCTTFSLKELVIRAPERNYCSPVREGMVFLSMSKDELLRIDQYQSNVTPAPTSLFQHVSALRQRTDMAHRARSGQVRPDFQSRDEHGAAELLRQGPFGDIYNFSSMTGPDQASSASLGDPSMPLRTPTFYVMTECIDDDDEDDDEIAHGGSRDRDGRGPHWRSTPGWSPTPLRNRTRRRLPAYDGDSFSFDSHVMNWHGDQNYEDEDDDDYTELYDLGDATISSPESPPDDGETRSTARAQSEHDRTRVYNRTNHGREYGDAPSSYSQGSTFESRNFNVENGSHTTLPNAEFHIEKNKNKCTIHFNPPVTARYILLKMWSPPPDPRDNAVGNIDIQGVVAKGFAGPRYFPAMELR